MPANLDYELYFNIAFFAVIGIGFLIGLIRGLKKSLYALIVTLLFYGLFFVTIDAVVNQLWVLPLPFLFTQLGGVDPALVNAQTLGDAFSILLESYLGEMVGDMLTNEEFLAFVTGVALFAVKLVYTVLYFTVFQVIYRFIFFIVRIMFFGRTQAEEDYKLAVRQIKKMKLKGRDLRRMKKGVKKDFKQMSRKERRMQIKQDKKMNKKRTRNKEFKRMKKETKLAIKQMSRKERRRQTKEEKLRQRFILKNGYYFNERQLTQFMQKPSKLPLMGAFAGAAKGAVSAFVTLIILGGMINIMESFISVLPEDQPTVSREYLEHVYLANGPIDTSPQVRPMASPFAIPAELESQLDLANDLIEAFNNNVFVSNASSITYGDENYDAEIPLHLFLFDSVLSFNYREEKIMFRQELDTFSDTAGVLLNSEYVDTNDISDITADEIIELFDTLSNSRLVTSLLPLGIEVGSEVLEVDVAIPTEELYAIDWKSELQTLGSVAAVGFELVNTAGLLNENADLTTVTLDGDEVESLFDSLADSELATLGAYVAIEPLLESAGGQLQAIITVPADLDWADEFRAFGEVANAVLSTGITMQQLSDGDPTEIIGALSTLDFTILLNSDIVTQAMINIFSGAAGLEGLDMIVIPDGIEWLDLEDGGDVIRGELYNILSAVNAITTVFEDFSFENIDITFLSNLDNDTIDTIFESDVLVATISNFVTEELDLGDTPLVIPDSVFDLNGYITNGEMKAVVSSVKTLIDNLPCDDGDTACQEIGFDFEGALTLETSAITTVVQSDIIGATVGNLIVDQAGTILTIPTSAMMSIDVDEIPTDIISKQEIIDMFSSIAVLEFDDLETMEFDASIINNLAQLEDDTLLDPTKTAQLFGSKIVHATISHMLIDLEDTDGILVVPKFAADDITEIREYNATDDLDYVSKAELDDILQALLKLNISDFTAIDSLDLQDIIDNKADILASSILQATVTKQVLDLGTEIVTVPFADQDGNDVRVIVGDPLAGTDTEYIVTDEISAILDALVVLDATDIQNFSGDVDVQSIASDSTKVDTLLSSATIHATMTAQLLALEDSGTLAVPYFNETETVNIRVSTGPVGNQTEFIIKSEIQAMLDVLNLLGITDNLDQFTGNVNIGSVLSEPTGVDTLLSSATIHATISKQLFDLETGGTLAVPYFTEDGDAVRVTVGDAGAGTSTDYMTEAEVRAMLDVLDLLGIADDLENFDGSVNIGAVLDDPAGVDTLLSSATIHATISKQLFDLGTGGTLSVPYFNESGTAVRVTVGDSNAGTETNYMTEAEVRAMLDVLDLLGIADDLENFNGSVNLGAVLGDPTGVDTLMSSATIHATISKQLFDLGTGGTLAVPYFDEDGDAVRVTVGNVNDGTNTDYMTEVEVRAMLDVLDLLGIADDLENFDGAIDMGTILADPANYDILLASSTIQATMSKQLFDLNTSGTLVVPYVDEDSNPIRATVGDELESTNTEYILEVELRFLLDALNALGLADNLDTFDGQVDIAAAAANKAQILASATIQATISKQMIDLDTGASIVLPFFDEDGVAVRVIATTGNAGEETEYVTYEELDALISAMDTLGIVDDIANFSPSTVNLSILGDPNDPTAAQTVFASAMIQATVSDQLLNLTTTDTFVIPYLKYDDATDIRFIRGDGVDVNTDTEFILSDELIELVQVLDLLGITDVETFTGNINLNTFFDPTNRAQILESSIMQATISAQMLELGAATLPVPYKDIDDAVIRKTVASGDPIKELEYISVDEIDAMFGAFEVLGINDFDNFTGVIDISVLDTSTKQNTVLASASVHSKISELLTTLDSAVLIVPVYSQDGETAGNEIRLIVGDPGFTTTFIVKSEIRALMDSFSLMGYSDLNSFPAELDSSVFFNNRATLLLSASIQATISDKMINGTGGELVVPDQDVRPTTAFDIRLEHADGTVYIEINELNYIFDALEALGLTNFATMSFNPGALFSQDMNTIFLSASMQATISKNILNNAIDETGPQGDISTYISGTLVVPTALREAIAVDGAAGEHIDKNELIQLLEAMDALGFNTSFGDGVGGSAITSMDDPTLDEMFDSGTIHTTIHFMLEKNTSLIKPDQAKTNLSFLNNINTEAEIRYLFTALGIMGNGDFSSGGLGSPATIFGAVGAASDRSDMADSMIVRATLHDQVEAIGVPPFYNTAITAADYMDNDTNTFFIKATFLDIVNTIYPPTS